ncbi:Fis family transcriptional regulator [Paenibacillus herberti]|uniref:Fis family transcriptional regulator n=2 Tax=Paenibacillus herberti TaxID=1619309 RepID=A0A229P6B7_9BACL|nr:Fis family transcriptional regulator [Paenibacillus herberti]
MSYSKFTSASVQGVDGCAIAVEVDLASGLPQIHIVGLPDPSVRESVERVRAALRNCGFQFPMQRITVNLAPADIRKEGTAYDLAIAAAILTASGQLEERHFKDMLVIGELALSGELRKVPGVLPMVEEARRLGMTEVLLPAGNAAEASLIGGMKVYAAQSLTQLAACCRGEIGWRDMLWHSGLEGAKSSDSVLDAAGPNPPLFNEVQLDYVEVLGQHGAKRALAIAAAGRHNLLMSGPPGTGKTMLIRRLPGILPPMTVQESLEVTKIFSVAGKLPRLDTLITQRPFRAPHHTISAGGLVGGGSIPRPGEVTLAHRGVLFLDELPEFPRSVLEVLRQPLEDREVTLARARAVFRFPASFQLAASMNPCPCGYFGAAHTTQGQPECSCSQSAIDRYRSRISGPMLDRIDLLIEVQRPVSLDSAKAGMSTADMQQLVQRAVGAQQERRPVTGVLWNSELSGGSLRRAARLKPESALLLQQAFDGLGISLRAHDRILKLSRTIADMEGCSAIETSHVAEAIQYRRLPGWN